MSEVVVDTDTGRENRRFTDLFADFDIGNGQYFVTVERIEPKVWETVPTRGELPEIWKPMSWDDFKETYGGHRYELIVYRQAGQKPKRCSKPITVHVPEYAPVIDVVTNHGRDTGEDESMAAPQFPGRGGRAASNAEARMHEANLSAEERREERRERLRKEQEEELKRQRAEAAREAQRDGNVAMQLLQRQLDEKAEEMKELRATINQLRSDDERKGGGVKDAVEMAKVMRPSAQETEALRDLQTKLTEQHQQEITRLMERSAEEVKRLTERHQDEVRSLREQQTAEIKRLEDRNMAADAAASARVAAAETRATERIAAVEAHAATQMSDAKDRIREVEQRMEKAVAEVKLDGDRRVTDIQNRHTERVQDIERQHKREIENVRERGDLHVKGETTSWQTRLDLKEAEIIRLRTELEQVREEAKKPLADRINELATAAEAIGYSKDAGGGEEAKDWKQTGLEILSNVAANFPEILRAAGDTLAKAKGPAPARPQQQFVHPSQALPPVQQNPALPPPAGRRRGGFATEDGPAFEGPAGVRPPVYPTAAPAQTPRVSAAPPAMPPQPALAPEQFMPDPQVTPPVMAPQQIVEPTAMAPQQAPEAAPVPPVPNPSVPPSMMPVAAPAANDDPTLDAQILQLRPLFEGAYSQNASPDDLAQYCIGNFGKPTVAMILQMGITPERVLMAMQRGGFATSKLCRRDGQKYLQATFAALKKLAA